MGKAVKNRRLTAPDESTRDRVFGLRPDAVARMAAEARDGKTVRMSQEKADRMADAVCEMADMLKEHGEEGSPLLGGEDPELAFRRQRAEAREAHLELKREGAEGRAEARLIQELVASETVRTDDARDRRLMRWITGGSFVATLAFSLLTAKYHQPWGYAGMGIGVVFFGGGLFIRLRLSAPGGSLGPGGGRSREPGNA